MPIIYDKLFKLLENHKITSYTIRKNNIISQSTLTKLKHNKQVNTGAIETLCKLLDCQPGDIMEYVPDDLDTSIDKWYNIFKILCGSRRVVLATPLFRLDFSYSDLLLWLRQLLHILSRQPVLYNHSRCTFCITYPDKTDSGIICIWFGVIPLSYFVYIIS